jgi:hypothetical protein
MFQDNSYLKVIHIFKYKLVYPHWKTHNFGLLSWVSVSFLAQKFYSDVFILEKPYACSGKIRHGHWEKFSPLTKKL